MEKKQNNELVFHSSYWLDEVYAKDTPANRIRFYKKLRQLKPYGNFTFNNINNKKHYDTFASIVKNNIEIYRSICITLLEIEKVFANNSVALRSSKPDELIYDDEDIHIEIRIEPESEEVGFLSKGQTFEGFMNEITENPKLFKCFDTVVYDDNTADVYIHGSSDVHDVIQFYLKGNTVCYTSLKYKSYKIYVDIQTKTPNQIPTSYSYTYNDRNKYTAGACFDNRSNNMINNIVVSKIYNAFGRLLTDCYFNGPHRQFFTYTKLEKHDPPWN